MFLGKVYPSKKIPQPNNVIVGTFQRKDALQSEIDALKSVSLVACFNNNAYDWNFLPGDLLDIFELETAPIIKPIGGGSYLLTFKSTIEMESVMAVEKFTLWDCIVTFSYWRPAFLVKVSPYIPESFPKQDREDEAELSYHANVAKCLNQSDDVSKDKCGPHKSIKNIPSTQIPAHPTQHAVSNFNPKIPTFRNSKPTTRSPSLPHHQIRETSQYQNSFPMISETVNHSHSILAPIYFPQFPSHISKPHPIIYLPAPTKFPTKSKHPNDYSSQSPLSIRNSLNPLFGKENNEWDHFSTDSKDSFEMDIRKPEYCSDNSEGDNQFRSREEDDLVKETVEFLYLYNMDEGSQEEDEGFTMDTVQLASTFGINLQVTMFALKKELLAEMDEKTNKGMEDIIEASGPICVNG